MSTIQLPRKIVNTLLHHAQLSPDDEICGLIAARDNQPTRCYPVANTATSPETRFQMDPQQQIDTMRRMREANEELFAIYHSHPSSPAAPSLTDISEANYPDTLNLIISLTTKGVLEMRGFRIRDDAVTEIKLVIAED